MGQPAFYPKAFFTSRLSVISSLLNKAKSEIDYFDCLSGKYRLSLKEMWLLPLIPGVWLCFNFRGTTPDCVFFLCSYEITAFSQHFVKYIYLFVYSFNWPFFHLVPNFTMVLIFCSLPILWSVFLSPPSLLFHYWLLKRCARETQIFFSPNFLILEWRL